MAARRGSDHGFSRADRVAEQVGRELAELIRFGIKDPRLAGKLSLVTLTGVEVSPDYAHAKVFYTSLNADQDNAGIAEGLRRSAGFLRRELGRRIRLHNIPELHFQFDASVAEGSRLSQLIDEAVRSDEDFHRK